MTSLLPCAWAHDFGSEALPCGFGNSATQYPRKTEICVNQRVLDANQGRKSFSLTQIKTGQGWHADTAKCGQGVCHCSSTSTLRRMLGALRRMLGDLSRHSARRMFAHTMALPPSSKLPRSASICVAMFSDFHEARLPLHLCK